MARKPLVIDSGSEFGRLLVLDLGGGNVMLMVEGDRDALTFPLDGTEARAVAKYLTTTGGGLGGAREGAGRPVVIADDALREVADHYQSEEAAQHDGGRVEYVAHVLGIGRSAANYRVEKARRAGLITATYRSNGAS